MEGQAYAKKLQELSLNEELENACKVRGGKGRISPGTACPKSPTKSQKNMAGNRTSAQPYNLPKATGPGGLVAMLDGLKKIRKSHNEKLLDKPKTVEKFDTVEKMILDIEDRVNIIFDLRIACSLPILRFSKHNFIVNDDSILQAQDKTVYFDANSTLPLDETLASTSRSLLSTDVLNNNIKKKTEKSDRR